MTVPNVLDNDKQEKKHVERFWIYFAFKGTMSDFTEAIEKRLQDFLKGIPSLFLDIQGELVTTSQRGKSFKINQEEYYHGNITFDFRYVSEKSLSSLFANIIMPFLLQHLNRIFNTGNCAILENIYPGDYFKSVAKEAEEEAAAVIAGVKKQRPDIPDEFIKSILTARPFGQP